MITDDAWDVLHNVENDLVLNVISLTNPPTSPLLHPLPPLPSPHPIIISTKYKFCDEP